ncbi:MAG: DUF87 domain-containing protein [Patescibacteria group bacterium]
MALFNKQQKNLPANIAPVLPDDVYREGLVEMRDIIAPSAFSIASAHVQLGNVFTRTMFVLSYPRTLAPNWFGDIISLDKVYDVSIFIHPADTAKVLKDLQKQSARVLSQIRENEEKGMVRDPMLDTAYRDIETLRDRLQQATEKYFSFGLYITVYADSADALNKAEHEVRSILSSKLIETRPAMFRQKEGLHSTFPMGTDLLGVNYNMNTAPISSVFPFSSLELTSDRGILYGMNRSNASLVIFDRYSLENYNSVILATSGAGKSYTAKLEIIRSLMLGTEVIIIDPEREYEFLAESIGGRAFNISLTSKHHINPFDLPTPREDESLSDVLRSHIIGLVGLFRIMLGGLTPEEDAVLDRAITETYATKDITAESDFTGRTPPLLTDLELVLSNMEGGEALAMRLRKYTTGTWAGFLNQHTNVDITKKLTVFSVRDMQDDLRPIAMYLIVQHIWNAIRQELKKRILLVDEAWWMMKSEDGASFLFGIAKRARKYYLGLMTITQDVADFMGSQYGRAIITNSSVQLLLKQSPSTIDIVKETFHLTDEERYLLLGAEVGTGIFFAGMKHVAIRVISSYTEHQIITSDPSEILAVKQAKEEYASNQ